jgi:DNA-binding NarL/FixJ family response regulator
VWRVPVLERSEGYHRPGPRAELEARVCPHCGQPLTYSLTPAECRVLRLLCQGMRTSEIAEVLVVAPSTVKSELSSVYGKLHVRGRVEAVLAAQRLGLVELALISGNGPVVEGE